LAAKRETVPWLPYSGSDGQAGEDGGGKRLTLHPPMSSKTIHRVTRSPLLSIHPPRAKKVTDRLVTKDDLERGLKELVYRLVIRLGGMIVVAIGVIATLVKLR
jgi:hypothetical protein